MLARNININNFDEAFNSIVLSPSEEQAYKQGQLDYWQDLSCKPSRHNYYELSMERNHYEAGYVSEEILNN